MRLRAIVAAWMLGALLCLEAGCSRPADGTATSQRPSAAVETIMVAPRAIARTHESVGELRSPQSTTITAEIAGKIVALDVPEGREVEAGHLLVRIDDAQARAAVAVNRARSRNAREILERLEALRGEEITSQQERDTALAEREATAGELETAETLLAKTEIRAPFRGALGLRTASLGDYVEPGEPIVQLTQTRPLDLVFGLPERYVSQVALEQRIAGLVPTCETFAARVTAIDPRIDPESRVVRIKAEVANADGALLPGMSAVVQLTIGEEPQALTVPQAALLRRGTERMVYVVRADDTVEERPVAVGTLHADWAEVRAGLTAGEVVVVTGHQKLAPGTRVAARPYAPIENPNLALGEDGVAFGCTL
jgi:membrane fusion protein (multidrug efflux system)